MANAINYNHDFSSCKRTYTTLCIYHDSQDPNYVTEVLGITPDRAHKAGEITKHNIPAPASGWFLSTKEIVVSKDIRAHIEWILNRLDQKIELLDLLVKSGFELKISCFWESASGNGGPIFDRSFIKRLSGFPFDLHFDIWF